MVIHLHFLPRNDMVRILAFKLFVIKEICKILLSSQNFVRPFKSSQIFVILVFLLETCLLFYNAVISLYTFIIYVEQTFI